MHRLAIVPIPNFYHATRTSTLKLPYILGSRPMSETGLPHRQASTGAVEWALDSRRCRCLSSHCNVAGFQASSVCSKSIEGRHLALDRQLLNCIFFPNQSVALLPSHRTSDTCPYINWKGVRSVSFWSLIFLRVFRFTWSVSWRQLPPVSRQHGAHRKVSR